PRAAQDERLAVGLPADDTLERRHAGQWSGAAPAFELLRNPWRVVEPDADPDRPPGAAADQRGHVRREDGSRGDCRRRRERLKAPRQRTVSSYDPIERLDHRPRRHVEIEALRIAEGASLG